MYLINLGNITDIMQTSKEGNANAIGVLGQN